MSEVRDSKATARSPNNGAALERPKGYFSAGIPAPYHLEHQEQQMGVIGIGGIFFRARDPKALNEWYKTHLNVGAGCNSTGEGNPDDWYWQAEGGQTVFAPFKQDTTYFAADKQFMFNFKVRDIDGLLASLRAAGIEVETRAEWDTPETGRFGRIHDPEGNAIELWEPPKQ